LLGFVFEGASFGALSSGRVAIIGICLSYLSNAITIAVRYSAVRKQFGPEDGNEFPVLEYQLQVQNNSVILV
jgi:acyl-CoA oxidase